ncbi:MAG: hypothetical protein AB7G80_02320 [Dongiaceae bacterium]
MQKGNNAGYHVHHLESLRGQLLIRRHELSIDDVKKAVDLWHQDSKSTIRTVIGVGEDGLIGSERDGWHPDLPDAFSNGLVMIPWVQILELLKRVPDGTTGVFLEGKTATKQ